MKVIWAVPIMFGIALILGFSFVPVDAHKGSIENVCWLAGATPFSSYTCIHEPEFDTDILLIIGEIGSSLDKTKHHVTVSRFLEKNLVSFTLEHGVPDKDSVAGALVFFPWELKGN